jgi:hypothetical protein
LTLFGSATAGGFALDIGASSLEVPGADAADVLDALLLV